MPFKRPLSGRQKRNIVVQLRGPVDRKQLKALKKLLLGAIKNYRTKIKK